MALGLQSLIKDKVMVVKETIKEEVDLLEEFLMIELPETKIEEKETNMKENPTENSQV